MAHQQPHLLHHILFLLQGPITSDRVQLQVAGVLREVQLLQSILFLPRFPFQVPGPIAEALPSQLQVVPGEPYITKEPQATAPLPPIQQIHKQFHLQVPITSGRVHPQVAGAHREAQQ